MNYQQLQRHAATCEMEADSMAILWLKARKLMMLQSVCDFNLFWLHDVSPLLVTDETIDFLLEHRDKFKKISVREFNLYDMIIKVKHPADFDEFEHYLRTQDFDERLNNVIS